MGTLRRRARVQQTAQVTDETKALFAAGDRDGLHRALRLPPWQVSPLDAVGECPYTPSSAGYRTWHESVALREALE